MPFVGYNKNFKFTLVPILAYDTASDKNFNPTMLRQNCNQMGNTVSELEDKLVRNAKHLILRKFNICFEVGY